MPLPSGLTYNTGLTWDLRNITQDSTFPEKFMSDVIGGGYEHIGLSGILNDPNDYNGVIPNKFMYVKFDTGVSYAFAGMTQDRTDTTGISQNPITGEWASKVSVGFKADASVQTEDGKKGVILILNGTQSVNDGLVLLGSVEDEYVVVQRSGQFDVYVNGSLVNTFNMPLINGNPYKLMMAFYGDQETLTIKGGAYTGEAPTYGVPTAPKIGVTALPKTAPTDPGSSVVQVDITPPTTDNNSQIMEYVLNVTGPSNFSQDIVVAFSSTNYMFSTEANNYTVGSYTFKLVALTYNGDSPFSETKSVIVYPQPTATIIPFLGQDDLIYLKVTDVQSLTPISTNDNVTLSVKLRTDPPTDKFSFTYDSSVVQTSDMAMNENYYLYVGENPNPILFTTNETFQLTVTKTFVNNTVKFDYSGFSYSVNDQLISGNDKFQVYDANKQQVGSPQSTTYTITGLTRETSYTYTVGYVGIFETINIKSYTAVDASFTSGSIITWLPNYTWVAGSYNIGTGVVYNGVAYVTTAIVSDISTPPDQNTAEWTTTTLPDGYTSGGGGGGGGSGGNNGGTGHNNMATLTYNLPKSADLTYDESVVVYGETAVTRPDYTDALAVSVPLADLNKVLYFAKDGEAPASDFSVDLSAIADAVKTALEARLGADHPLPALSAMGIDARSILSHTVGEWTAADGTLKTADTSDTARNVYEQAADKGKLSDSVGQLNLAVGDTFVFYLDSSATQSLAITIDSSVLSGASTSDVAPLIPFASIFGSTNAAGDKGVISNTWTYKFTVTVTAA